MMRWPRRVIAPAPSRPIRTRLTCWRDPPIWRARSPWVSDTSTGTQPSTPSVRRGPAAGECGEVLLDPPRQVQQGGVAGLLVEPADQGGQRHQQRRDDGRVSGHHLGRDPPRHHDEDGPGAGGHGGHPRAVVDQGELPERLVRAEDREQDVPPSDRGQRDGDRAGGHDVHAVAGVAAQEHQLAGAVGALAARGGQPGELRLVERTRTGPTGSAHARWCWSSVASVPHGVASRRGTAWARCHSTAASATSATVSRMALPVSSHGKPLAASALPVWPPELGTSRLDGCRPGEGRGHTGGQEQQRRREHLGQAADGVGHGRSPSLVSVPIGTTTNRARPTRCGCHRRDT